MRKVNAKYLLPFLLILLVISAVSIYLPVSATGQAVEQIQLKQNNQVHQLLSWSDIWNILRRKKLPLGSRGNSNLCLIAPGLLGNITEVWSDRPLFLWRGRVQKIAVRPQGSETQLWSQSVTAEAISATYRGAALQPGQLYEWLVFVNQSSSSTLKIPFRVIEAQRRDRMTVKLTALEVQLRTEGVSDEAIALAKANYFVQNKLWSDVLQQAFLVQNPSAALSKIIRDIPNQLCNQRIGNSAL